MLAAAAGTPRRRGCEAAVAEAERVQREAPAAQHAGDDPRGGRCAGRGNGFGLWCDEGEQQQGSAHTMVSSAPGAAALKPV